MGGENISSDYLKKKEKNEKNLQKLTERSEILAGLWEYKTGAIRWRMKEECPKGKKDCATEGEWGKNCRSMVSYRLWEGTP